ncbi:hypothetical protein JY458_01275 [Stenotrophomonas maltophilia]|nr:hypothetical protein [Stenotrophomonas maltophilia]
MAGCRWAATALCLVALVASPTQWLAPPVPSPIGFQNIPDDRFLQLRRQAMQFVEARSRQGYQFVDQREGAALQIYCRDVPVLWLERHPDYLLLRVSLDARQRAPAVVQLRALLQWQMEPLGVLQQALAGVPEPVLMERALRVVAAEVPDGARCRPQ